MRNNSGVSRKSIQVSKNFINVVDEPTIDIDNGRQYNIVVEKLQCLDQVASPGGKEVTSFHCEVRERHREVLVALIDCLKKQLPNELTTVHGYKALQLSSGLIDTKDQTGEILRCAY